MKFISWNINGIRAIIKKDFSNFIREHDADIYCFQETKANESQIDLEKVSEFSSYHKFWNSSIKPGYSGTLICSKIKPKNIFKGIGIPEHDQEGRVLTAEFENYYLVNVYTPNSGEGLKRLSYRQVWDYAFLDYLNNLRKDKEILVCGDLNVAHKEIDIARPKSNKKNAGFTDEERSGFDRLVESGLIDTFREFDQSADKYTWWSYRTRAREKNIGWRIDYWLSSPNINKKIKNSFILDNVFGSDHCPVGIDFE